MTRFWSGFLVAVMVALTGCSGGSSSASRTGSEGAKGVAGQYYYVNIFTVPVGGRIHSTDGKIDCGTNGTGACGVLNSVGFYQTRYAWTDTVELTATPAAGQVLISWAGDCSSDGPTCTLAAGADKTVVAIFGTPGSGHPNFTDPAIHGPAYLASVGNANPLQCATCHGNTLDGMSIAPSCNACHDQAGFPDWQNNCTFCHGAPPPKYVGATPNPPHPAASSDLTQCTGCHATTVDATGAIIAGGTHMDGQVQGGGHPAGFDSASVHGPQYLELLAGGTPSAGDCTSCHGTALTSCDACHSRVESGSWVGWQSNCTFCHGTRVSNGTGTLAQAAPPDSVNGRLSGVQGVALGAHAAHVTGTRLRNSPVACTECHSIPGDLGHVDGIGTSGARATVVFGTLATQGTIPPAVPSYSGSNTATTGTASGTCSNTYCHGNFPQGTNDVRSSNTPSWAGAAPSCTGCHTMRFWGHTSHEPTPNGCADCHAGYTASSVNPALHLNGVKDSGGPGTALGSSYDPGPKYCSNVSCHGWGGPDGW